MQKFIFETTKPTQPHPLWLGSVCFSVQAVSVLSFLLQVPNSLSVTAHGAEVQYGGIHSVLDQISYSVTVSSPSNNESESDFTSDDSIFSHFSSSSSESTYS